MQVDSERERYVPTHKIGLEVGRLSPCRPRGLTNFSHPAQPSGRLTLQNLAAGNRAALRAQIADRILRDLALLDALDLDGGAAA